MKNLPLVATGICALLMSSCKPVEAPAPVYPLPSSEQIEWQKKETYAFVHFGLNTFNDLEWGYGDTPAETFNPSELNCEQWVRIFKEAGMKGVILTAKHHDGFCLWPTETVDYNIARTPYKNGRGDLVRELSDACRKYGLEFGLYLSPWDRHHAEYGREGYRTTYHRQIEELTSSYGPLFEFWFDGANGGDGWYGGADEVRSIEPKTYYGYEEARETIKDKHPDAMIFGGTVPDIRWIGNERGMAGQTNWAMYDYENEKDYHEAQWGMPEASKWIPGECDVSIRPGWFYHHREDHQVKSVPELVDLYYRSVGRNANFLLNFPVALNGKIHPVDSANAVNYYRTIQKELKNNLLADADVESSSTRGRGFAAGNVVDGDWNSYWATADDSLHGSLTFHLPERTKLNRVLIQEYIPLGQRIGAFRILVKQDGGWIDVETSDSLTTIGYKRIIRFKTVETESLRIDFTESRGPLCINNVEAYCAPALLHRPGIQRDSENLVRMIVADGNAEVYYTLDGSMPTPGAAGTSLYREPFLMDRCGTVNAICYDRDSGENGPVASRRFDLPAQCYQVLDPVYENAVNLFDDNGYTVCQLTGGAKELSIQLDTVYRISGFNYTPDQRRDATGHISRYELLIEGKKVAEGEFSNIKNHPIRQEVHFPAVEGKNVIFRCIRTADGRETISIGEFSLITENR